MLTSRPLGTSTGTVILGPPPANASITGYAALGLDSTTFDPLCNFACPRGYCPSDYCDESIQVNPVGAIPSLPTLEYYEPLGSNYSNYSSGDFFSFVSPDTPNIALNIVLVGTAAALEDVSCDDGMCGSYTKSILSLPI